MKQLSNRITERSSRICYSNRTIKFQFPARRGFARQHHIRIWHGNYTIQVRLDEQQKGFYTEQTHLDEQEKGSYAAQALLDGQQKGTYIFQALLGEQQYLVSKEV